MRRSRTPTVAPHGSGLPQLLDLRQAPGVFADRSSPLRAPLSHSSMPWRVSEWADFAPMGSARRASRDEVDMVGHCIQPAGYL